MKSPEYVPVSGTVLKEQNEWLNRESRRRALPKSALLREAIELLIKKYNHVEHPDGGCGSNRAKPDLEAGTNEGYLVQGQAKLGKFDTATPADRY